VSPGHIERIIKGCIFPEDWGETFRTNYIHVDNFKFVPGSALSEQGIRDKVLREKLIEIGNKLEPYFDENSPLYVGSVMTLAGQALRTVMESLRSKPGDQP
jgi:hypothetical protein